MAVILQSYIYEDLNPYQMRYLLNEVYVNCIKC